MHVADLVTPEGRVTQRTETTPEQKRLFTALGLPEPPVKSHSVCKRGGPGHATVAFLSS